MIAGPSISASVSTSAPNSVIGRTGATVTTYGARGDADLATAPLLPRGETHPGEAWIDVDGVRIDEGVLIDWSVAVEDGGILQWSASSAAESLGARGPMGFEGARPAMFGRDLEIGVTIGTADYVLASGARVVDSARGLTPGDRVIEVSGLGLAGQYDRLTTSLALPPEHGNNAGEIATAMLLNAGVPAEVVAIGSLGPALVNPVDIVDEPAIESARDVLGAHGYALVERGAELVAVPRSPIDGAPRVTLRLDDVVAGGAFAIERGSDVPAVLCVEGSRNEIPGDALAEVTTEEVTTISQVVGLKQAVFQQTSGGTLAPTGLAATSPERERLTARTTRRETSRGGCLIARETIDEALHRRAAARYNQDTDATPLVYHAPVWVYESGAVADDTSPAYLDRTEQFREVARNLEEFDFGETSLELEGIEVSVSGWANPPAAVQTRTATTQTWESVGFVANQRVLADGSGVVLLGDEYLSGPFRPAERGVGSTPLLQSYVSATTTAITSDNGYIKNERDEVFGRRITDGWRHRYADGTESNLAEPLEGITGGATRSWSSTTAGGARREEVSVDADGKLVERVSSPEPNGAPAVARCDRDSRLRASSIPVIGCVASYGVGTLTITSPWIETVEQAEKLARIELRVLGARRLSVAVPILPALREHDRVDVWMPEKGVEVVGSGWVESIEHAIEPGEASTTRITELVVRLP